MSTGMGPVLKLGAAAVKKGWKPAAGVVGGWAAKKYGDRLADESYEKFKGKAFRAAEVREHEALAQSLCRARGWRYQRFVVDHAERFLVWDDEKRPVAAFPPIPSASTPEALAARFELVGYEPPESELKSLPR